MTTLDKVLLDWKRKTLKSLGHLEYSYKKVSKLKEALSNLDEESLETWESFAARFSRSADIFLSKYLRTRVLLEDPGFRGSFRDMLDQAEKLELIDDANAWMKIRALRNSNVHEYTEEDLPKLFKELEKYAPILLSVGTKL